MAAVFVAGGAVLAAQPAPWTARPDPSADALIEAAAPEVERLYAERGAQPLWSKADGIDAERAGLLRNLLEAASSHGLDADSYLAELEAALLMEPREREAALSSLLLRYHDDLRTPVASAAPYVVDDELQPDRRALRAVFRSSGARELATSLKALQSLNPLYDDLREAYMAAPEADLRLNMERTRGLPRDLGARFILVNIAAARLWTFEHGRPADEMKVAVGSAAHQTPAMTALIRHAVLEPYWNIPEDLAQSRYAPQALRHGPAFLMSQDIEVLSDWTPNARAVPARSVDWRAVADGAASVRLRQRPGPANMMGRVKYMFPNPLGIYLHDTPDRRVFERERRTVSAGCIRLADAERLWRWLYGDNRRLTGPGVPEQVFPLAEPAPVYLLYLTAWPDGRGGIERAPDVYGLDVGLARDLQL